jgi:hypothetical protein
MGDAEPAFWGYSRSQPAQPLRMVTWAWNQQLLLGGYRLDSTLSTVLPAQPLPRGRGWYNTGSEVS